jgi:uncharacterized protein (TIGR02466 family)
MNLETWFQVPVWFNDITDLDLDIVKNKCLELMNSGFENVVLSNRGGWQSRSIKLEEFAEFSALSESINNNLLKLSEQINPDFKCVIDNTWININFRGNYNARHHHYQAALSGCIYIDVQENSGNIHFMRGGLQSHYPFNGFNSSLFHEYVEYQPKNGRLLIFPAWLEHEVAPNNSDVPRISIAFNVKQIF